MDSLHQMPADTPQRKKPGLFESRSEIALAILPVLLAVVLGSVVVHLMKVVDQQDAAIAAQKKQIAELNANLAESRDATSRLWKTVAGDGTRTMLVDTSAAGGAQTAQNLLTQSAAARQYGTPLLGRAWIIPRKIVPQSTDGSLGFQYAYLYPDGKVEGWFVPERAP